MDKKWVIIIENKKRNVRYNFFASSEERGINDKDMDYAKAIRKSSPVLKGARIRAYRYDQKFIERCIPMERVYTMMG